MCWGSDKHGYGVVEWGAPGCDSASVLNGAVWSSILLWYGVPSEVLLCVFCFTEPSPYSHLSYFRLILIFFSHLCTCSTSGLLNFFQVSPCKTAYAFIAFRHESYLLVSIPLNSLMITEAGQYLVNSSTNNKLCNM